MTEKGNNGLRKFNRAVTNRLTRIFAGRIFYALVLHTGRKSGKVYATPVLAARQSSLIFIPLPYGADTDWYLNVRAAGKCQVKLKGVIFSSVNPEIVEPSAALPAFPSVLQKALIAAGVAQFTQLQIV